MLRFSIEKNGLAAVAAQTARILKNDGAVAAVPSETVYGLVARVTPAGAERIYALKHRSGGKRLGWFVGDWRKLEERGVILTPAAVRLAERYLPGPLTLIAATRDGGSIGFRMPDHPFLSALLAAFGEPLYQTSANRSGEPDSLALDAALSGLDGEVDLAADGGALPAGALASTVVDTRSEVPQILRRGALIPDLHDL